MSGGRFYFLTALALLSSFILEASNSEFHFLEYDGFNSPPDKGLSESNIPFSLKTQQNTLPLLDKIFDNGQSEEESEKSGVTDLKRSRMSKEELLSEVLKNQDRLLKRQDWLEKEFERWSNLIFSEIKKCQAGVDKYQEAVQKNQNHMEVLIKLFNYGMNQLSGQLNDNNQKKLSKKPSKKQSKNNKNSFEKGNKISPEENRFNGEEEGNGSIRVKKSKSAPRKNDKNSPKKKNKFNDEEKENDSIGRGKTKSAPLVSIEDFKNNFEKYSDSLNQLLKKEQDNQSFSSSKMPRKKSKDKTT